MGSNSVIWDQASFKSFEQCDPSKKTTIKKKKFKAVMLFATSQQSVKHLLEQQYLHISVFMLSFVSF